MTCSIRVSRSLQIKLATMIVKCVLPFVWHKLALTSLNLLYFNTMLLSHPVYGVNAVGAREGPGTPLQIHLSVQQSLPKQLKSICNEAVIVY